jgi:hypothetical protein
MRRLELMNNLMQKEASLASQSLFDTTIVDGLLANATNYHLFYKYFSALSSIYGVHLDRDFQKSFLSTLDKDENPTAIIDKGFQLYEFLYNYGRYEYCRQIIERIVQLLSKQLKHEHQPTTWASLFRACCALIQVHNQSLEMKEAWLRIEAANEIIDNLKSMHIGQSNEHVRVHSQRCCSHS